MTDPGKFSGSVVGIVGLGQIGGSFAAALTARSQANVIGCDTDSDLVETARARSIVSATFTHADLIERADVVVLATPQSATLKLLSQYADLLRDKKLVIDTGSLKIAVCTLASELDLKSFVGCHPLAGSEKRAPEAWVADLFVDASFLMCPTDVADDRARQLVVQLMKAIGSEPRAIDPETHDRLFALTSGLPHTVAVALCRMFESEAAGQKVALAGPSFRSATRVASSDPALITHLLYDNRDNVADRLDKLIAILTQFRDSLRDNDRETFDSLLKD